MGGFVAGLTKAMGDPTLSDQQAEMRQRRLLLADAYRKNQLDQFQKAQQDIDTLLASKQVMDNGALRPLTPEEITDWTQKRQQVAQHIQNLYNPSFDPGR